MHTTHFIGNGPIQTAYHDIGSGPALVLVHGFTGSKLDFADQLSWFTNPGRVIAFDQRGHGESSNQLPYTEARYVADLISFLDVLELTRCDLLGHSFGGMIAMKAALDHPERFRSLILMDTAASPMQVFPAEAKRHLDSLVAELGCTALLEGMRDTPPSKAAQRGIDFLGETEHWRRIVTKLEQMDPEAFQQVGDYIGTRADQLPAFATLRCPLTVIVGAEDTPFLESSGAMAAAAPAATLEVIPDAGHSPQYENAPAWQAVVAAHLSRVRG